MVTWSWRSLSDTETPLDEFIRTLNLRMTRLRDVINSIIAGIQTVNTFSNGAATPSVAGASIWKASNTSGTSITRFMDGTAGQSFTLWATTANTTVVHDVTKIITKTGANVTLGANGTMLLTSVDGTIFREM